ncbi:MAG: DUF4129 domain-containing protein [Specibacter sp.]
MALQLMQTTLRPGSVPVVPDADEARRWAQEELAHKAYQDAKPGLADRVVEFLRQALDDFLNGLKTVDGSLGLGIVVGVAVIAILVIVFIIRPRLNRKKAVPAAVFEGEQVLTSQQHGKLAWAGAQAGDFGTAVSEQFRALVRSGEERDISAMAPGRTAVEVAAELALAFPANVSALRRAADLFNAVRYGNVPPTQDMYEELVATCQTLAATKPVYSQDLMPL